MSTFNLDTLHLGMQRFTLILLVLFLFSCDQGDVETSLVQQTDLHQRVDSIALGKIPFGMDRLKFISTLEKPPVQNKMTEPQFHELVTEVESHVTVGAFNYMGYYYFDTKERLYKIHLQHQNEERLIRIDHDRAYENLYDHFKSQYGPGTSLNSMPGLKSFTWILKNKKIELTGSCMSSNCTMECTITETHLFKENTIKERFSDAKLHLQIKLHPDRY